MDYSIITVYPPWFLLLCILAGILASLILYYRDKRNEFPTWLKRLLGINRFILVALISFLLLTPLLKLTSRTSEKPIILIAQDNSQSLVLGPDSAFYRGEYLQALNEMSAELSKDYEVELFTFGDDVTAISEPGFDSLSFHESQTNMSALFDMIDVRYVNRNLGALLIASDGIFNQGLSPLYRSSALHYPVYSIALGDTAIRRDAYLKRVQYNRIAYQGNDFPVEIILNANKMQGGTLSIKVLENGKNLQQQQVSVDSDNFSKTIRMNLEAGEAGTHHYTILMSANRDELTTENNRYDLFVDVLKSKQKVLILAHAPHPDVSALKEAISNNINYEVEDFVLSEFNKPLQDYSLIVLHQLPSLSPKSGNLMNRISQAGIPVLYIIGKQTAIRYFSGMKEGLQIIPYSSAGLNESLPLINQDFTNFMLSDDLKQLIPALPPLQTLFARYNTSQNAGILLYQKLGNVESSEPLWAFVQNSESRVGIISGTGLWQWRIKCWQETGDHTLFNELVHKSIQYLALKEDKRRFRVTSAENIPENRDLEIQAELYNESLEPYNDPDVELEIIDEEGNAYTYIFGRSEQAYSLMAGRFPVGTYTYRASTAIGNQVFEDEGGFTVSPVVAEKVSLRASHGLLEKLAEDHDGSMVYPEMIKDIPGLLGERGDIKPLIHAEKKYIEFIDIWWILALIIALSGLEWFLRKWSGSY